MTLNQFDNNIKQDKWLRNLEDDMEAIIPYIKNKRVTDIAIGKNGELIVEELGKEKEFTGIFFDNATITRIIYITASILGLTIDTDFPTVEGTLPNWNVRFEGILPPVATTNPMIFLRRPSEEIFTLESYVESGRMKKEQYEIIIEHIKKRSNIALGGETGSGKTTLLNAIIDKMREFTPDHRFYIVEDAGEIQCKAKDVVPIYAKGKNCVKAVGAAMRCNVSRIIFGELRYGDVTNELLKAWNSGHRGGITTVHANNALSMASRFKDLLREVIPGELPDISQSVQLFVHLIPTKNGPIVNEVVETESISTITNLSFIEELQENNLIS